MHMLVMLSVRVSIWFGARVVFRNTISLIDGYVTSKNNRSAVLAAGGIRKLPYTPWH